VAPCQVLIGTSGPPLAGSMATFIDQAAKGAWPALPELKEQQ
jgi:hypothetical protein